MKKRYNTYVHYLRQIFGSRVQKLSLDAGFSCPNRDGTKGTGGCTYCNNKAFNPSYCTPDKSITLQLKEGVCFHKKRYKGTNKYLAYFQAYSNTYAPLPKLKKLYYEALNYPGVAGLVIGTRPDCIDDEKLAFIKELSEKYYIIVEYGIESCYNKTLEKINRKHTFEDSKNAIIQTANYGIRTGAHVIFGLPGETRQEMLATADIVSPLPLDTIKFHQLQIIKDTPMEKAYHKNPEDFTIFGLEDYLEFVMHYLEKLNPAFAIERFAGEAPPRFLANEKRWNLRNDQIINLFEKKLVENDTWQGKYFQKKSNPLSMTSNNSL